MTGIDPATIDRVLHVRLGRAATTRTVPGLGVGRRGDRQGLRGRPRGRRRRAAGDPERVGRRAHGRPCAASTTRRRSTRCSAWSRSPSRRSTRRSRSPRTGSRSSTPARTAEAALTAAAEPFTDAKLHTGDAFAKDYTKGFASFLNLLYVMLAFSVVVSLFGMVNTLVLSVFERTRELGMLRTIGMTRRQARRMIRHESVITALIGAALGLPLGIFLVGARDPGAVAVRRRDVDPGADAGRVHPRRGARRHRRGDHPRPPGLAARRARRAALRMTATATIPAAARTARRGRGRRAAHRPLGAPAPGGRPRAR